MPDPPPVIKIVLPVVFITLPFWPCGNTPEGVSLGRLACPIGTMPYVIVKILILEGFVDGDEGARHQYASVTLTSH